MTLNFISGSTTIATVYVKNSDDSDALEQIIHDDLPSLVIGVTVRQAVAVTGGAHSTA